MRIWGRLNRRHGEKRAAAPSHPGAYPPASVRGAVTEEAGRAADAAPIPPDEPQPPEEALLQYRLDESYRVHVSPDGDRGVPFQLVNRVGLILISTGFLGMDARYASQAHLPLTSRVEPLHQWPMFFESVAFAGGGWLGRVEIPTVHLEHSSTVSVAGAAHWRGVRAAETARAQWIALKTLLLERRH